MSLSAIDVEMLNDVRGVYEIQKKAWGILNKKVMRGWGGGKKHRQDLNRKMRKSESLILGIVTKGVCCGGCGDRLSSSDRMDGNFRYWPCCESRRLVVRGGNNGI